MILRPNRTEWGAWLGAWLGVWLMVVLSGGTIVSTVHAGPPLAMEDRTLGRYTFRSDPGRGDFELQLDVPQHDIHRAGMTGHFVLKGLGRVWFGVPASAEPIPNRARLNVLQILRAPLGTHPAALPAGPGRPVRVLALRAGSGIVTLQRQGFTDADWTPLRATPRARGTEAGAGDAFAASNMRWSRCVAVDYSGTAGAPCLLVVTDHVRGGGAREMFAQFYLPGITARDVAIRGRTFRIQPDGAGPILAGQVWDPEQAFVDFVPEPGGGGRLRVYMVRPAKSQEDLLEGTMTSDLGRGDAALEGLLRTARTDDGSDTPLDPDHARRDPTDTEHNPYETRRLMIVLTMGTGAPPEIRRQADAGDVVVVGGQTIRYADHKVVFGVWKEPEGDRK